MFIQDLDATPSAPLQRQERTFYASETITVGQFLALDASKSDTVVPTYVKLLDENGDANAFLFCGVALEGASAGDKVRVCTAGYVADAVTTGTIAAKIGLVASTTAGSATFVPDQAVTGTVAWVNVIGVALEADGGDNKQNVWIYPTGF